jgi:hypothetical protein
MLGDPLGRSPRTYKWVSSNKACERSEVRPYVCTIVCMPVWPTATNLLVFMFMLVTLLQGGFPYALPTLDSASVSSSSLESKTVRDS